MSKFGSLTQAFKHTGDGIDFAEVSSLPDFEKERLCLSLLEEFGARNITVQDNGEITHSCTLPYGLHSNDDSNPSASINYHKLTFACFGCGGGGLLWWVATCRGSSTAEARTWLRNQTGSGPDETPLSALLDFFDAVYSRAEVTEPPMPRMDRRVLDQWMVVHPYMTEKRHVPEANLRAMSVGYGRIPTPGKGGSVDSERIIIPHFWRGDLVGWQSRRLADDGTPKYVSTPDFPKRTTLYNHDAKADTIIVVESPLSALRHLHHQPMVATFGASVTHRQMRLIAMHRRVVLWLDQDNAGWKGTDDLAEALQPYQGDVWVVPCPFAADPADMDDNLVDQLVAEAIPYSIWTRPSRLEAL